MKKKHTHPIYHISYWILVLLVLAMVFGHSWGNPADAIFFISFLLPVVAGTSYFFNYYLVPNFLLKKRYFPFAIYSFYTLIVSLLLELIVLTLSIMLLAQYKVGDMAPNAMDTLLLALALYMIVFFSSFLFMIGRWNAKQREIDQLKQEKTNRERSFLQLVSNRRTRKIALPDIIYIESFANYIQVNTVQGEAITSKVKISEMEKRLPDLFIRIHRSFIVNREKISGFSYSKVSLEGVELTIGRSYRKVVKGVLKGAKE